MTPKTYREEAGRELRSILEYWMGYATDEGRGGFIGRVDEQDRPDASAPKGLVLNARILWSFSAAFHASGRWIYRPLAVRAYEYLLTHFWDKEAGGFFWSLTPDGHPVNTRKQIYGQAFALYGLSEYHRATAERHVLDEAIDLYRLIEEHGYDHRHGGYFEAFDRHWSPLEDGRLSEKDANEKKTMNTNLHVLEAYANLYSVWPTTRCANASGSCWMCSPTISSTVRPVISGFFLPKAGSPDPPSSRMVMTSKPAGCYTRLR